MTNVFYDVLFVALLGAGIVLIRFGYDVLRSNRYSYERNRSITPSLKAVIRGEIPTYSGGKRDYTASAGVALDRGNRWIEQGKLSDEALSDVLPQ